jgi:hypothetical protein
MMQQLCLCLMQMTMTLLSRYLVAFEQMGSKGTLQTLGQQQPLNHGSFWLLSCQAVIAVNWPLLIAQLLDVE